MAWFWVCIVCGILISFLAIRFISPGVFYRLRNKLLHFHYDVRVLRSLDETRGSEIDDAGFYLARDLRRFADPKTVDEALRRVVKVRQLYECLDRDQPSKKHRNWANLERSSVCIEELSLVVNSLARKLHPDARLNREIVYADQLLLLIATNLEEAGDARPQNDMQTYWTEKPMSVEQIVELLAAAIFAIAYRVRSDEVD